MIEGSSEFQRRVRAVLVRFCAQNAQPQPSEAVLARFAAQLAQLVADRGLPRPLRDDECGTPGGMSDEECAPLVARVVEGIDDRFLADAARQLVKACFYPEFRICRDSFREVARDGTCRRQQAERSRSRISGAHCVDCPHWTALGPDEHVAYLEQEWRGDAAVFRAHRDLFLPEDFRAIRQWLWSMTRGGAGAE